MDQGHPGLSGRPHLLYGLYGAVAVLAAMVVGVAYLGYHRVTDLRQETSSCGPGGCATLAEQARALKAELSATRAAAHPARIAELETELLRLKGALAAAEDTRDRLAEQVAACGPDGCQALAARLAGAEGEVRQLAGRQTALRRQVAALQGDNRELRDQLAKEFSSQTGQRLLMMEIARIGPFEVGSFAFTDAQVADLQERLRPYKNTPLMVVGIADHRPYKGPSADLKQLGLMLARAQLVKSMGYEVYYQVRQSDPRVPESRGLIVYQMTMQSAATSSSPQGGTLSMEVPTFYTAH